MSLVMSSAATSMYPNIRAIRLKIKTRWKCPNSIPGPVIANVLRGAIGLTLRELVCPEQWFDNECKPCPLYQQCAYGQIFSPTPLPDAQQMRLQSDLPRPFVIEPPGLNPDERVTTEGLTFHLMLFGTAINSLPYFISTLELLGENGMGRDRVPFTVESITTCHPAGEESLFEAGSKSVSMPKRVITTKDLFATEWPTETPTSTGNKSARERVLARMGLHRVEPASETTSDGPQLRIKFLTPLLLKSGSGIGERGERIPAQEIRERPPFGVIIRRLRDRLSSLCAFFGERWECPDFTGLGEMADQVTITSSNTTWLTRSRQSTRTGQSHEISGLVGATTYQFPDVSTLRILSALLKFNFIHIGKHAPFGNGAIQVSKLE